MVFLDSAPTCAESVAFGLSGSDLHEVHKVTEIKCVCPLCRSDLTACIVPNKDYALLDWLQMTSTDIVTR